MAWKHRADLLGNRNSLEHLAFKTVANPARDDLCEELLFFPGSRHQTSGKRVEKNKDIFSRTRKAECVF